MVFVFIPQCGFCGHANPESAKFCNECGSPLHLKPCGQCKAINDAAAETCYKCGAEHPAQTVTPDAPAVTPGVPSAATAASGDATAERRPRLRVTTAGLLSVALLGAVAVSAFYAYRNPLQVKEWLGAERSPVDAGATGIATPGLAIPPPLNEPAAGTALSPVQNSVRAIDATGVGDQSPASDQAAVAVTSQPQISAREPATPPPSASSVERKTATATKTRAGKSKKPNKQPAHAQAAPSSKSSPAKLEPQKGATPQ